MTDQFSAASSAIGYLYQVRVALLLSLRRLPSTPNFAVSIETLDDVSFHKEDGSASELLQSKHHLTAKASLSDASPELWKSLRIWLERHSTSAIDAGTRLYLLTTASASAGSAASYLRTDDRNVDAALSALESVARSSTSEANAAAYRAFLAIPSLRRRSILQDVVVQDSAVAMVDIDSALKAAVFAAVERRHLDAFLERLEGWWFRRTIEHLLDHRRIIQSDEIEARQADLREQFKQDSLPIDDDLLNFRLDEATQTAHANSVFVRQIELIRAGRVRIASAIRDYYRAFQQRSRWLREELMLPEEHEKYERRLLEEWEYVFARMKDELGDAATDEAKEKAARNVLGWAEQAVLPFRPRVTEPFLVRGSLHMLSDEQRIGWHPEFRARLVDLLVPRRAVQ